MKTIRPLLFATLFAAMAALLPAAYLPKGTPDADALLAPPPTLGSAEDKFDLECTYTVHTTATPAEIALGQDENKLTIYHYAPAIGAWFTPGKFPRTEALFKEVEAEAKAVVD